MIKKIWTIFNRDLKVNARDFLSLFLLILPIIFALAINLLTPGINDTTVNLAFLDGENPTQTAYYADFAKVELFKNLDQVTRRVENRDNIVAILPDGDGSYYLMTQGNEPAHVIDAAKLLKTFYEKDVQIEDTTAEIIEYGRTIPPLKKMLTNFVLLFISVLGGMLIAINIVEEKVDNTISAINITPISRTGFILGKSLIGLLLPIFGTFVILWITGFRDVNIGQIILIIFAATMLSLMVGFIQGILNDDVISAAGSIKLLFLPLAASIAAIELLADKWQIFFYWSPFYWSYKGNDAVLSQTATWPQILLYTAIILALCVVVYVFLAPKIRKGLS